LALLDVLPQSGERDQQELDLQTHLGATLTTVKGFAAPEVATAYERARTLCRESQDPGQRFSVLRGLWIYDLVRAEWQAAADLAEAATQIAERSDVRAVLIAGNGPNFTVGGDLSLFAGTAREQLPNRLRRMIDSFHLAIERLTSIDAPVVAAVRGGAGGGGLGLLYAADIVVAADDARFALGYSALGLTADGGNTWFLPRMVGMRRAQELFLLNRRLTAQEALQYGLKHCSTDWCRVLLQAMP